MAILTNGTYLLWLYQAPRYQGAGSSRINASLIDVPLDSLREASSADRNPNPNPNPNHNPNPIPNPNREPSPNQASTGDVRYVQGYEPGKRHASLTRTRSLPLAEPEPQP